MRRGSEVTTEKLAAVEAELVAAEAALAEREQEHERLLAEISADAALGVVSPGDAATKTRPSEEALDLAREHVERLRRALPELRARLERQQIEQAERERQAVAKALADGCRAANVAAEKLAQKLREADPAAQALVRQREEVDRLAAESAGARMDDASPRPVERRRSLLWTGTGRTPDGWVDEVDYLDGLEVLLPLLGDEDGPRRPLHEAEVEARRKQAERARQDSEILTWVRRNPGRAPEVLARDGLSPAFRAEAEQILAEARSAASARKTAEAERARQEEEATA